MKERVLRIGKPTPLVGVVSEPDVFSKHYPAVIILNSGVMHHVGTCRLSVKLARALAHKGIMALRFDFSGIGDSAPRAGGLSFTESAPLEVKEMMDYLQKKRGINTFVLYGLCSGADASYETAKVDERVIGISQIDAYCYRNWRWYVKHYGPRLFKLDVWTRFIGKALTKSTSKKNAKLKSGNDMAGDVSDEYVELPSYIRVFPPREEVSEGLKTLIDRGVAMYNIFTGGQTKILNHAEQFQSSFSELNFAGLLRVEYLPEAEHIITEPFYQKKVVDDISDWVCELAMQQTAVVERTAA